MKRTCLRVALAGCVLSAPVLAQNAGAYSDQTLASGLKGSYGMGHWSHGGGAVGDFDRDGWQDFFYPTGAKGPDKLFLNNGDGTFREAAASWGVDRTHLSTAAAVGDFDGDGWLDIFVTSLGAGNELGKHVLYHNNGDRTFTDVAVQAGVHQSSAIAADAWGAAWGDYDLDGHLDLAVCGWWTTDGNRLFHNQGDGTFTDVTASAGLSALTGVHGFAARFVDMDGDLYPELLWIGDFSTSRYFVNDGDGTFTDATVQSGTNQDASEMGFTVGDLDQDGDFDIYVTTVSTNNLYLNRGRHEYQNVARRAGVEDSGFGWGTVAIDFNHDSLLDLVATASGRQYAFLNVTLPGHRLRFAEVAQAIGLVSGSNGRGFIDFDYDNDGDRDLIILPSSGPLKLFRNDLTGSGTNWLRIFLDRGASTAIAPDGIGSTIELRLGARRLLARIDGGSNYLSQSELSAHFGLGAVRVADQVRVRWTDGTLTILNDVPVNQTLTIHPNGSAAFCVAEANSTGFSASLIARGRIAIAGNALSLEAQRLPVGEAAVLLFSLRRAWPPSSQGALCIGGPLYRVPPVSSSSASGSVALRLDFDASPLGQNVFAGTTALFQLWYRDGGRSNLTNGVQVTLR